MASMKAVRFHVYGGPDVLRYEDAPKPEPKAGEVLIKVKVVGVNPVERRALRLNLFFTRVKTAVGAQ